MLTKTRRPRQPRCPQCAEPLLDWNPLERICGGCTFFTIPDANPLEPNDPPPDHFGVDGDCFSYEGGGR